MLLGLIKSLKRYFPCLPSLSQEKSAERAKMDEWMLNEQTSVHFHIKLRREENFWWPIEFSIRHPFDLVFANFSCKKNHKSRKFICFNINFMLSNNFSISTAINQNNLALKHLHREKSSWIYFDSNLYSRNRWKLLMRFSSSNSKMKSNDSE